MALILNLVIAAGLLIAAARPLPAAQELVLFQRTLQNPVEQQTPGGDTQPDHSLWVVNPTLHPWDADDIEIWQIPNARRSTFSATQTAIIADGVQHLIVLQWSSQKAVRARIDVLDPVRPWFVETVGTSGLIWITSGDYDASLASPALAPIEGSNGGVGALTPIMVTLVTLDGRATQMGGWLEISMPGYHFDVAPSLDGECFGSNPKICRSQ